MVFDDLQGTATKCKVQNVIDAQESRGLGDVYKRQLQIIQAAQSYAATRDFSISIAVVDGSGLPIALSRMDGAPAHTAELALSKAFTATSFQVPTAELGADAKRPAFRSLTISSRGRILDLGGGVPIVDGLTFIGAVGVSGGKNAGQDILCCRAGLSVLNSGGH